MLIGVKRLARLALRRDRITVPVTISLAVAMVAAGAPALVEAYDTYERQLSHLYQVLSEECSRALFKE